MHCCPYVYPSSGASSPIEGTTPFDRGRCGKTTFVTRLLIVCYDSKMNSKKAAPTPHIFHHSGSSKYSQ